MENKYNLERIEMTNKALALAYSEENIKPYFPKEEYPPLKVINSFVEENLGKLYFDISNNPIIINENKLVRNLFAIFEKEDENKFLELMKYAKPNLGPEECLIYSKETIDKILEKSKIINNYFEEKGQKFAISKIFKDNYCFIPLNKKGYSFKNKNSYDLRIKDDSKILNEMWFRNSRKIYTIEDKVY